MKCSPQWVHWEKGHLAFFTCFFQSAFIDRRCLTNTCLMSNRMYRDMKSMQLITSLCLIPIYCVSSTCPGIHCPPFSFLLWSERLSHGLPCHLASPSSASGRRWRVSREWGLGWAREFSLYSYSFWVSVTSIHKAQRRWHPAVTSPGNFLTTS